MTRDQWALQIARRHTKWDTEDICAAAVLKWGRTDKKGQITNPREVARIVEQVESFQEAHV